MPPVSRCLALVCLLAACSDDDPCAGAETCVKLDVASATVARIDQLELDVVYGARHATTTTRPDGGGSTALPLATAIVLELDADAPVHLGVVAAGKLGAGVLGTGAASTMVARGDRAVLALELAPAESCGAGAFYCGGDRLAGDPDTLYQCNAGGVPIARGVCAGGCAVRPTLDDVCRGTGGTCVEGSRYCGGDKLDGDPGTLYTCRNGAGASPERCAVTCEVRPGLDDLCR
jgi:hypothetical protein